MLILLSPTKKQRVVIRSNQLTQPRFISEAQSVINKLRELTKIEIINLFKVSEKIADENFIRFQDWSEKPTNDNGSEALYTFTGEVFNNLDPDTISNNGQEYLLKNLVIFSGLYGLLKPSDIIMPYRLDIGDSLKIDGENLYKFWKEKINSFLIEYVNNDEPKLVINLASGEYTKYINWEDINAKVITPEFRVEKNGKLKNVAIWSKKMRGLLARSLAENNVDTEEEFKKIELPGFQLEIINGKYFYIKRG